MKDKGGVRDDGEVMVRPMLRGRVTGESEGEDENEVVMVRSRSGA